MVSCVLREESHLEKTTLYGGATIAATLTIGSVTYPNIAIIEDQFDFTASLQERGRFQCDVIDYTGNHFVRGEIVTVSDPVLGNVCTAFIDTDKEVPEYPTGWITHTIDCIGLEWLAGKRTYTRTYTTSSTAGKILVDMLSSVLSQEGIYQNYAEQYDSTQTDFSFGILSGTAATLNVDDGNLELQQAGSNLTIVEDTTAQFATGTLSNCVASGNALMPTTVSGLEVLATLPFAQIAGLLNVNFWSGSKALGTNDTLNFTMFIASTSPAITISIGLLFSDLTFTTGILDQNGFAIDAATDISANAKDQWYVRAFSLTPYNGKTVSKVYVSFGGTSQGVYTCYIQNVYLSSSPGSPFFSTTATTTQLNPMVVASSTGYASTSVIAAVNPVVNPSISIRTSPAYNIDPVKLLRSSLVTTLTGGTAGGGCSLSVSYDGGATYHPCVNNAPLPALPAGSNISGLTMTLQEGFTVGSNPTILPTFESVSIALVSAPNATKSDVVTAFATQAAWNTGTLTKTVALVNGDLTTTGINEGWNKNLILNQTFFTTNSTKANQSVSKGTYTNIVVVDSSTDMLCVARLDWAGTVTNSSFSLDIDVSVPSTFNFSSEAQISYFRTYWNSSNLKVGNGGYTLTLQQSGPASNIGVYRGTNSSTNTATTLALVTQNAPSHVKITVVSGLHTIYFDNNPIPVFTFTDTTYTSGQIGIGAHTYFQNPNGGGPGTFTFANPVISPTPTVSWIGPSASISSLVTCGNTVISWTELNTGTDSAVFIESSIDGGATYQTCINGSPIPGLISGMSVAGLSVKLAVNFYVNPSAFSLPILRQLVWRVLGAYPGSSGTRSTAPLGNDMSITRTVGSGWNPAFDGQSYTQVGTGATAVSGGEATITNTTGDVHMALGSRTWGDVDGTVRFAFSASTISAGIELRYVDANNFYRLQANTTTVSIIKRSLGVSLTLATVSVAIPINTYYYLRFRVVGSGPIALFGNVWQSGALEPTINVATGKWNDNLWTITASD
jgi:hypothetical protein